MISASQNAKVHGVLVMLSLRKPGKMFNIVTSTLVFYHVSHRLLSTVAIPCANALNLLHSFTVSEVAHTHIYKN